MPPCIAGVSCGERYKPERLSWNMACGLSMSTAFTQMNEGRSQMRFVIDEQRINCKQSCMLRTEVWAISVAGEKQPAADHVYSADYDRGSRGVFTPLLV